MKLPEPRLSLREFLSSPVGWLNYSDIFARSLSLPLFLPSGCSSLTPQGQMLAVSCKHSIQLSLSSPKVMLKLGLVNIFSTSQSIAILETPVNNITQWFWVLVAHLNRLGMLWQAQLIRAHSQGRLFNWSNGGICTSFFLSFFSSLPSSCSVQLGWRNAGPGLLLTHGHLSSTQNHNPNNAILHSYKMDLILKG